METIKYSQLPLSIRLDLRDKTDLILGIKAGETRDGVEEYKVRMRGALVVRYSWVSNKEDRRLSAWLVEYYQDDRSGKVLPDRKITFPQ